MTNFPSQTLPRDGYSTFPGMPYVTEFQRFVGSSLADDVPANAAWGTLQAWPLLGGTEMVDVPSEVDPSQPGRNRQGRRLFFLTLPGAPFWIIALTHAAQPLWQPPGTVDLRLIRTHGVVEYPNPMPHRRSLTAFIYLGASGFGAGIELVGANGQTLHQQTFEPGDAVLFDDRRLRPRLLSPDPLRGVGDYLEITFCQPGTHPLPPLRRSLIVQTNPTP